MHKTVSQDLSVLFSEKKIFFKLNFAFVFNNLLRENKTIVAIVDLSLTGA